MLLSGLRSSLSGYSWEALSATQPLGLCTWQTYLSWVHDVLRVKCVLHSSHYLYRAFAQLIRQILLLAHTDTMLARTLERMRLDNHFHDSGQE